MSKVTYAAVDVVWVSVLGERVKPFPACREDSDDIVGKILHWLQDNEVFPVRGPGGVSGGGMYMGAFEPDDAPRLLSFLKSIGAEERADLHP